MSLDEKTKQNKHTQMSWSRQHRIMFLVLIYQYEHICDYEHLWFKFSKPILQDRNWNKKKTETS